MEPILTAEQASTFPLPEGDLVEKLVALAEVRAEEPEPLAACCEPSVSGREPETGEGLHQRDVLGDAGEWQCPICLDTLYKPCVNVCGHVYCFWCINSAMSPFNPSKCPLCRQPYCYFPAACRSLHLFLSQAFPAEYGGRRLEVEAEELQNRTASHPIEAPSAAARASAESAGRPDDCCHTDQGASQLACDHHCAGGAHIPASPVMLNCGHAVCGLISPLGLHSCSDPQQLRPSCPECSAKVQGPPVVCFKLATLLEALFPEEYRARAAVLAQQKEQIVQSAEAVEVRLCAADIGTKGASEEAAPEEIVVEPPQPGATENAMDRLRKQIAENMNERFTHHGIGCDACGMYPIVGPRWKCQQCNEAVGFDMCGECHSRSLHIIGRFNQQHNASHTMRLMTPNPSLLHLLQATNPELDVVQILSMLHIALDDDQTATSEQASRLLATPLEFGSASHQLRRRRSLALAQQRSLDLAAQGQMPEPVSEDGLGTVQILGPYQSREPGRGELVLAVYAHGGAFDSRGRHLPSLKPQPSIHDLRPEYKSSGHTITTAPPRRASGQFPEGEHLSAAVSASAASDAAASSRLAEPASSRGSIDLPQGPYGSARSSATASEAGGPEASSPLPRPSGIQRMMSWFRRPRPGTPFS